ncbi:hypothetical protein J3A83DRAFT_4186192 [Scleroderma citrinum]
MGFISLFTSLFVPSHAGKEKGHTFQNMPLSQTTEVVIHPLMDVDLHENLGQDSQQTSQEAMFTFTPPQITATSVVVSAPLAEMHSSGFRLPLLLPASMPGLTQSVGSGTSILQNWDSDYVTTTMGEKWDFMYLVKVHKQLTARDSLITEQGQVIKDLQRDIAHSQALSEMVDSKGQSKEWCRHHAERDSIMIQQTQAIQQLKDNLTKVGTTMNSEIQKLKDQRDTELAAMAKTYDAAIHQNEKSTESGPPGSCHGHKIIGALIEENGLDVPAQPAPPSLQSALPSCVPLSSAIIGIVAEEVYQLLRADLNPVSTSPAHLKKPMKGQANMKAIELQWEKDNDPNHNENQQHICDLFLEIFNHSTDKQFINHDIPKCEQVNAFATGSGPRPTELGVHWDLVVPLLTPWNQMAQMWQDKGWTSQPQSNVYWQDAIVRKFQHIKLVWEKSRPCAGETPSQTAVQLMGAKDAKLKKACVDTRQRAMATELSYLRTEQGDVGGVVWKWLSDMVMKLGADGMSLEESDKEDLTPVFHIKRMP